jgi:ABC-type branched-subunit amino acid transport system substrate-binding protein
MNPRSLLVKLDCVLVCLLAAGHVRADDIVLGMSAAFKGPNRALGIEYYRGANAYFQHINEHGGIDGRNVVVQALDDEYKPVRTLANTDRLVKDGKTLSLFGYVGTPTTARILPLLTRLEKDSWQLFFPFTGADVLREWPYDKYVYNLRPSYRQETSELVERFVKIGRRRIGVFYQIDAYGRTGWDGVRKALQPRGLSIVAEATYKRGTEFKNPMTAQVDILRQAQPDAIISIGVYPACAAFIRDARAAGWDVPIANVSFVGSEQMLELLEKAGTATRNLINSQVVPSYNDTRFFAVGQYRVAMDRYRPLPPPEFRNTDYVSLPYGFVSFEGYLAARVMVAILKEAKSLTRPGIAEAAERLTDFSLGLGHDQEVSFRRGQHQGLQRIYFTVVRNGKFVALADEQWKEWQR